MSNSTSRDGTYEWKAVATLSFTFGLVGLDRFVLPPLFPAMMKDLHLTYQDLGNLVGILGLVWGIAAIVVGNLSDRLGRKNVLVPAVVLFSLLSALSGMATSLASLLVIRAVMGAAEGAVAPTGVAVVVEASQPKRRGMNNGVFQCAISLFGLAIGPVIATQLLRVTTWRHVFYIVGAPGLIAAAIIWFTIREPGTVTTRAAAAERARASVRTVFGHRNIPLAMLALLCAMTGVFVISAIMPNYLIDFKGLTVPQMGFVTSAVGVGGFLGQFGVLTASDFIGRRRAVLGSFLIAAVFLWFFLHAGANTSTLFVLLLGAALFNFGALAILAGPIPAEAAPLGLMASAAGIVIGAGEIFGGGVAPSIAGAIAQNYGIQYTLYFALTGLAIGAAVSLFLKETAPRMQESVSP